MNVSDGPIPEFIPHPLLRGGHAQTLAGAFLPGRVFPYRAVRHLVDLDDGDRIVLHDDCPPGWTSGRAALLVHGLGGCHQSGYMGRIAGKLTEAGVRAFRLDLRSCGAGAGMAKLPYHAGRSEDVRAALRVIERLCPGSPLAVVGFSLGGNMVLKMLGEAPRDVPESVDRAMAVNPSLRLRECVAALDGAVSRHYDRYFVRKLLGHLRGGNGQSSPEIAALLASPPRTLLQFDDCYTAPASGFGDAANYYERCSAAQFVPDIRVPTLILAAADDPVVPPATFENLSEPAFVRLHMVPHGGHLGYVARGGGDPDRRWMDWRVVQWVTLP